MKTNNSVFVILAMDRLCFHARHAQARECYIIVDRWLLQRGVNLDSEDGKLVTPMTSEGYTTAPDVTEHMGK